MSYLPKNRIYLAQIHSPLSKPFVFSICRRVERRDHTTFFVSDRQVIQTDARARRFLFRFRDQTRPRLDRFQETNIHFKRDGCLPVRIARGSKSRVGERENRAAMRCTMKIDHLIANDHRAFGIARLEFQQFDSKRFRKEIVFNVLADLATDHPTLPSTPPFSSPKTRSILPQHLASVANRANIVSQSLQASLRPRSIPTA